MSDLIDRRAAIDAVYKCDHIFVGDMPVMVVKADAYEALAQLPSAQPEIVRCRDCRWRKDQSGSTAWLPCRAIVTPSDFYCGRAERRTDGSD